MRLPSVRKIAHDAGASFRRFPVLILNVLVVTVTALLLADREGAEEATVLNSILLAGFLGIPLLTGLALMGEKRKLGRSALFGIQAIGVLALVGYALSVPTDLSHAPLETLWRFFILAVGMHLFVAFAPFMAKGEENGFWHYNKALFLRLFTAGIYSGVLFAGLAIALAALENLFSVDVPEKRYLQLWILASVLFNTWFFLSGIPEDLSSLETWTDYPKGLKVFAQYILFPIVLIYFLILYAYLGKILLSWDWPQGYVSKLILGFSGTGMFFLLLLHPIKDHVESAWISKAARSLYVVMIPLLVMLFLAVWRRVSEYGITEGRYLALALGIWLTIMTLYFILSKNKSIKVIPASLSVLAFLVSFGPWGAFSVASNSQIGRLEDLATKAGILTEGKVHPLNNQLTFQEATELSAILSYLHEYHGLDGIQSWFDESLRDESIPSGVAFKSPATVATLMGFEYVSRWNQVSGGTLTLEADGSFLLSGYDRIVQLAMYAREGGQSGSLGDGISYRVTPEIDTIIITAGPGGRQLLSLDFGAHVERLITLYQSTSTGRLPSDQMRVRAEGNGLSVCVCPWLIQAETRGGERRIRRINAVILYSAPPAL